MTRTTLIPLLVLVGCRPPAATPQLPPAPVATKTPVLDPALVARGSYIASISGCVTCHTADASRPLAGGVEGKFPDGSVWRTPNITPDARTGTGAWKTAEMITAVRQGIRPDGIRLAPIMPYPFYHRMTDRDARALASFLLAQSPIEHRVERSDRSPLRPLELPRPVGNIDPDDVKGHGEYLAALMHCGACHTPTSGPHANVAGAGGTAFVLRDGRTIKAPNITSDPETGIGRWSEADIARTVRTMVRPDGVLIQGPMASYKDDWNRLTETDAYALALYIKSLPAVRNDVERSPTVTGMP
jgi:mono/diheme cytochrome c family protein